MWAGGGGKGAGIARFEDDEHPGEAASATATTSSRGVLRTTPTGCRTGAGAARYSSAKSGRRSSSKVARSQLATTAGVSARTEAVRGTFIASPTSPK